jgi:hopanoid biosynthesis associated protein HpnK
MGHRESRIAHCQSNSRQPGPPLIDNQPSGSPRRLIVTADDFGRSRSINAAVLRAHREGILTAASLMVNEEDCDEAVAVAKENPRLGVGLHLTLLRGHSALLREKIPGLVNERREFGDNPVAVGARYFLRKELRCQLKNEITAQFEKFRATGLQLDHVNGHLHFHFHPVVFQILMENAANWGIRHLRLTCDRCWLNLKLARGRLAWRLGHAALFRYFWWAVHPLLQRKGIRHTRAVFGLMQDSRVDEEFILKLLPRLPGGDCELYSHPSLDQFRHEFDALVSPRVQDCVRQLGIGLIRYQDL